MTQEPQSLESVDYGTADPGSPDWSPDLFQSPERDAIVRRLRALVPRINEMIRNRTGGIENAYAEDEDWSEPPESQ